MKKYIPAVILGTIGGAFTYWAFDSFHMGDAKYFLRLLLKSIVIPIIVVTVLSMRKKT